MFSGPEGIIVLILVLVLFGGSQLPKLARNLGRAQKEFKDGLEEANKGKDDAKAEAKAEAKDETKTDTKSAEDDIGRSN